MIYCHNHFLVCIFLLGVSKHVIGTVTISPSTVAQVCRFGEHLLLTCSSTNASFLIWRFSLLQEEGLVEERSSFINRNDVSNQTLNVVVNSTRFTTMRVSTQGTLPLITTLLIDNVSSGLNGTVIECAEIDGTMEVESTTIHIIGINNGQFNTSFVVLDMSEIFGLNKIMLVFRLSQESDVVYNVSIVPQAPVNFTTSTDIQLTLSYNTSYNFTIEAATICRNSSVFNTEFNYLKCGHPLSATADNISLPSISGYSGIPGSEVSFNCSGLVLIGNKTATCMSNGRWYPDSTEVICTEAKCGRPLNTSRGVDDFILGESVIAHSNSSNSSTINFSCPPGYVLTGPSSTTCMSNGQWQPDPSGVECNEESSNIISSTTEFLNENKTRFPDISLQRNTLIGIISGITFSVMLCIVITFVIIYVTINKKGLFRLRRKAQHHVVETRELDENYLSGQISQSEYSLIQLQPLPSITQHLHEKSDDSQVTQETLIYADIKTSDSFNKQQFKPCDFEDNHIEYAQINHKLIAENLKPSISYEPRDDHCDIVEVNLDTMLIQLRNQITSKWYQFGEVAGVKKEFLDDIASKCSRDDCIIEMFDRWLRNYDGKPTWRDVAKILRAINHHQLANEIEQVYNTGQLPIQAEMDEIPQNIFTKSTSITLSNSPPPPIPPKTITLDTTCEADIDEEPPEIPCKKRNEGALPPLPPKPTNAH